MSERTRAEQIAGIYELALWLEQNPEIPIPWDLTGTSPYASILIHATHAEDQKRAMAAAARAIPGTVAKRITSDGTLFMIEGTIPGGVRVKVAADRDEVCKRVVTGTREVTKTVPDPMVVVPVVEVTETVEDVEWVCEPLLSERERQAVEDETVRAVLQS